MGQLHTGSALRIPRLGNLPGFEELLGAGSTAASTDQHTRTDAYAGTDENIIATYGHLVWSYLYIARADSYFVGWPRPNPGLGRRLASTEHSRANWVKNRNTKGPASAGPLSSPCTLHPAAPWIEWP